MKILLQTILECSPITMTYPFNYIINYYLLNVQVELQVINAVQPLQPSVAIVIGMFL